MNLIERRLDDLNIVDANSDDYDRLVNELSTLDVRIDLYATGEDALRAHDASASTVWIVNIRLPDMSGISFLTLLRRRMRQSNVFLVGNHYSAEDELVARSAGATAYLCKPASAAWLIGCRPRCRSPAIRAGPASYA